MSVSPNHSQVLVTGGSGFVASHTIAQLLQQGYRVRTTLRRLAKQEAVLDMLARAGVTQTEPLSFVEADLMDDRNWQQACMDCDFVLHIASPIFLRPPKHEDEMVQPAVQGTLRVLKAARDAGVKRMVMTSNFGAVGYSHKDPSRLITEDDWTNSNEKGLSPYNKSKVMAESSAWGFITREGGELELSVVNPMGIFGPQLSPVLSSGPGLLKGIIEGSMKRLPNISLGIVDVRDVASLHLLAMTHPQAAGERFLALAGGTMTLRDIADLVRQRLPHLATHISRKALPDWAVRLAALFSEQARALQPMLGINRLASNEKARTLLGWQPRGNDEAILASAQSLEAFDLLK